MFLLHSLIPPIRILSDTEIHLPDTTSNVLTQLAVLRQKFLEETVSDHTILIMNQEFSDKNGNSKILGISRVGRVCNSEQGTSANYDKWKGEDLSFLSVLLAHELGHNLGMVHDNEIIGNGDHSANCPCDTEDDDKKLMEFCGGVEKGCIMNNNMAYDTEFFSVRSRLALEGDVKAHSCLYNPPEQLFLDKPECGNAIVESGEECDCGSDEDCPFLDPCCEVGTCKLKATSSCYTGSCCDDKCQLKPKGTMCRPEAEGLECDFSESCTGIDPYCPRDTYKQDGRECSDTNGHQGFCYLSDCQTKDSRCKYLFGDFAEEGPAKCWEKNLAGNYVGNCGYLGKDTDGKTDLYRKCDDK
eukprot:sb/3466104/